MKRRLLESLATLCVPAALACGGGSDGAGKQDVAAAPAPAAAVPVDGDAFLQALWPLPTLELAVVYDVSGPAGMTGTLELLVREGGFRRENWLLEFSGDGVAPVSVRGTTIMTPTIMWSAVGEEAGQKMELPVKRLAAAYDALSPGDRRKAADALQHWRAELADARAKNPGETREVAGERCLWTRVAAQTLCIWEETGLPLRYEGAGFQLEAVRIDRAPTLAAEAFVLPSASSAATSAPAPATLSFDPAKALSGLIGGDPEILALALQPGFRPPLPATP